MGAFGTRTLVVLVGVALTLSSGSTARATLHEVLGIAPDGSTLATLDTTPDPLRGFHRWSLTIRGLPSGTVLTTVPLVELPRYAQLRERGEFELLRYEQEASRIARTAQVWHAGFQSCRPLLLRSPEVVQARVVEPAGEPGGDTATAGAPPFGELTPSVEYRYKLTLPRGECALLLTPYPERSHLVLDCAWLGSPTLLADLPHPELHPSPYDTVVLPWDRVVDVLVCGADKWLVALVQTACAARPDVSARQALVVTRVGLADGEEAQ